MRIERIFVMDGIVVVFEVTVYDSETRCPVMFCQHDSCEAATDYVRRQLGKPHNSRYGYRIDKVWYNSEYYRKELAELC